jgi:hypothetical protein
MGNAPSRTMPHVGTRLEFKQADGPYYETLRSLIVEKMAE